MTRDQKQYGDSFLYENFMKRAYRSDRNFSKGIDNSVFRLLEHIENGHYGKKSDYPKQVQKLKNYLVKAIEKVQKWKLTAVETSQVDRYAAMIHQAYDGDDLAEAIDGLLKATQRFKEY
jgi:hypothetical protein